MKKRNEIKSHGIRLPLSNHKKVRRLKKDHMPTNHGHRVWPTSWLLVDFLRGSGLTNGQRVLDVGCGWGLAGIYCARNHKAVVTCVDGDDVVYPYIDLLAEINNVTVDFIDLEIDEIKRPLLKDIDIIIGSDICFCDTLIDPLRRLINRAKNASVSKVCIADPGRWPFDDLADLFLNKRGSEMIEWQMVSPVRTQGKILTVTTS